MPVLSMMMRMAELWGYRPNSNPCKNTRRYRMKPMERFLGRDDPAQPRSPAPFWCPHIVAIVRKPSGRKTVRIYLKARIAARPARLAEGHLVEEAERSEPS